MEQHQQQPIKMFFSTSDIQQNVLKKDDTSSAYIIMQNNELHTHVHNLKEELSQLKYEKEELEQEVDSLSKTRTCLQGYVKNELELTEHWKTVSMIYEKQLNLYYKRWFVCIHISTIACIVLTLLPIVQLRNALLLIYVPPFVYYNMKDLMKIKHKHTKDDILVENKESIEKIEKSNIYIQDLIDNI